MTSGDPAIRTTGLTKYFGRFEAVSDLALDVREGDIYGFLGANGSGKTTTVRMLLGLVLATSGEIEVLGRPMPRSSREVLPLVGSMVEGPAAYAHLSGRANLKLFDAMALRSRRAGRVGRVEDALDRVGLGGVDDRPVKNYSLGMRQRLGLASALLRRPRLLVLDEPTNGLDPQGIRDIRALLLELNATGTTIFVSSHLLAEIEQLCTRVGVLDRGRLVVQEQLADLRAPTGRILVGAPHPDQVTGLLGDRVEHRDGTRLAVRAPDAAGLNAELVGAGIAVDELSIERRSLEEIVLAATSAGTDTFARPDRADRADRAAEVAS
ncbi:ABC transporter ATP-binding protein [soil metagenome]